MVNTVEIQRFENELELIPIETAEDRRCFILFGASKLTENEKTEFIEKECARLTEDSDEDSHRFYIAERMVISSPVVGVRTLWPK